LHSEISYLVAQMIVQLNDVGDYLFNEITTDFARTYISRLICIEDDMKVIVNLNEI
jgi:hypothetical protein